MWMVGEIMSRSLLNIDLSEEFNENIDRRAK